MFCKGLRLLAHLPEVCLIVETSARGSSIERDLRTRIFRFLELLRLLLFTLFASYLTFHLFGEGEGRFLPFLHSIWRAICQAYHGTFLQHGEKRPNAGHIFFGDVVDIFVDRSRIHKWRSRSKEFE